MESSGLVRGLAASVDECCSGFGFNFKVSRWESDQHLFAWENSHQGGMLSAWLDDTSYDVAISFYRRLNICLMKLFRNGSPFYVCKFWKIATKVAQLLGVRTQENGSHASKHGFIMGNRPFRLYPPFTCRLQHQREKNPLFSPLCML